MSRALFALVLLCVSSTAFAVDSVGWSFTASGNQDGTITMSNLVSVLYVVGMLLFGSLMCYAVQACARSCQCCSGAKSTASQQYQMVEEENKAPVLYSAYRK